MRSIPTIRSRLVVLVAACLLPAALIAAFVLYYNYYRERDKLVDDSITTARTIAALVDKDFANVEAMLRGLATSPSLTARDFPAFYQQAQMVTATQAVNNIVLADPAGKQIMNTLRPFGAILTQKPTPARLRRLAETNGPIISELFFGEVAQRPVIIVAIPVRRDGKHLYNLSAGIFPEQFAELLRNQNLPPDWIAAVVDSGGTMVARSHEMKRFVGKRVVPSLSRAMAFDSEGSFDGVTSEGVPILGVFSRTATTNWAIAIGIPVRSLTAKLETAVAWLVFATIALFAISLGVARVIGGKIAKSIQALREPALALGNGKEVRVPDLHLREAQEVGNALIKASQALEHAQYQANHDALTGLANQALFNEIVNQQITVCERNGTPLSLLYIDLDGFKAINDTHGHAVGDQLLCAVAGRLTCEIRQSDLAARLGGDEFAVALVDTSVAMAAVVALKLVEVLSQAYDLNGVHASISASIGIACHPDCGHSSQQLLLVADEAMYRAKMRGKRQVPGEYTNNDHRIECAQDHHAPHE